MQRRQFVMLTAGTGAATAFGLWRFRGTGRGEMSPVDPQRQSDAPLRMAKRTARALGSEVTLTVLHEDSSVARNALDAAFHELALVERLMSIYRPDSELSRLNRDARLDDPHPHLVQVLQHAETTSRLTDGAFDVTVQPLWQLYSDAQAQGQLPDASAIARARKCVNWRQVVVNEQCISLGDASSAVTLNGIAQGFAADRVMAVLAECGVRHALVNTGEISSRGHKQPGEFWTVGIQHPRRGDAFIALADLSGRCLATSGDYATSFSPDHRCNHVFDPQTGQSPDALASVSIVAPTAMQADALSTAAMVMGIDRTLALIATFADVDAMFVDKDGQVRATSGFPESTIG